MKAKRVLAAVICLNLCLTMAACGGKDNSSKKESSSSAKTTAADKDGSEEKTDEADGEADSEEAKEDVDYNVEKTFWKANVPETLKENVDSASEGSDYSKNKYEALNSSEEVERSIKIEITTEDALDYRKGIISYDVALKDYADGKLETVTMGGLDFAKIESEYWGEINTIFKARYEAAQMSITILVTGDVNSDDIQSVLNTIEFTLPEGTETDAPYPWDGEPLVTVAGSADLGGYKMTANQIIASESILPTDIFDNRVAVVGDTMYALSDYRLDIFKINGTAAELQETIEFEEDYSNMSYDENGNVYISGFMAPLLIYRDGKQTDAPDMTNQLAVSPDGSFGIEFFTNPGDVKKLTFNSDGTASSEAFAIGSDLISVISEVSITKDYILVSGSSTDDSGHKLFMFDHSGKYLKTLTDAEGESLGSITGAIQTDNGILATDGNLRNITLWDNDGKCLGEIEDSTILGTNYPWISGLCQTKDGEIYISLIEERPDKSWDEMIMFRIDTDF